jgi:hypothetical protein
VVARFGMTDAPSSEKMKSDVRPYKSFRARLNYSGPGHPEALVDSGRALGVSSQSCSARRSARGQHAGADFLISMSAEAKTASNASVNIESRSRIRYRNPLALSPTSATKFRMHHIDRNTPWEEIWEAFNVLHQQGKVLYFGSPAYRAGTGGLAVTAFPRAGLRTVLLQPADPLGRAGGAARGTGVRQWSYPVGLAGRRSARRASCASRRRAPPPEAARDGPPAHSPDTGKPLRRTRNCAPISARTPPGPNGAKPAPGRRVPPGSRSSSLCTSTNVSAGGLSRPLSPSSCAPPTSACSQARSLARTVLHYGPNQFGPDLLDPLGQRVEGCKVTDQRSRHRRFSVLGEVRTPRPV